MRDDNALMALVKNGNHEAYNEIVRKHRVSAISFACSFLSDLQLAEDAVQDVFMNIYLKRETYEPVCEFKTFLYQAVRYKCIDYVRKNKIRSAMDMDSVAELADSCSIEELYFQKERETLIFALMNNLKHDYKTALYLSAVEGVSYQEIAEIMGKTIPQIKILIFRARKKLKGQYREVLDDEE